LDSRSENAAGTMENNIRKVRTDKESFGPEYNHPKVEVFVGFAKPG